MKRTAAIALIAWALVAAACTEDPVEQPRTDAPPSTEAPEEEPETPTDQDLEVRLVEVAQLQQPIGMAARRADDSLYFAQKSGQVVALRPSGDTETVLDLSGAVSQGGEQGLLGLAFSPDGRFLYTNHTDPGGDTRITEWRMSEGVADARSRRELLSVPQPFANHNGGNIAFGPDGYLYIGLGDGGAGGDPEGNAQDLGTLLGKMLRIDPRPSGEAEYAVPPDNPFTGTDAARPEIWAFGLRNPWRFSFDRETGDLWIADVGQGRREEISFQPGDSNGGENYGWDRLEGSLPFEGDAPEGAVAPIHEYGRDRGRTVIGGYVYRGSAIPALQGAYVFADFFEPELRILRRAGGGAEVGDLGVSAENVAAFGEDNDGELYVLSIAGPVYRLEPR